VAYQVQLEELAEQVLVELLVLVATVEILDKLVEQVLLEQQDLQVKVVPLE
jgi:hypothetical protein